MDEKKQIEEMAKDIYEIEAITPMCEAWFCSGCRYEKYKQGYCCDFVKKAEKLYNTGYRKQSDTARDIIKDILWTVENCTKGYLREHLRELAEKYGVKID